LEEVRLVLPHLLVESVVVLAAALSVLGELLDGPRHDRDLLLEAALALGDEREARLDLALDVVDRLRDRRELGLDRGADVGLRRGRARSRRRRGARSGRRVDELLDDAARGRGSRLRLLRARSVRL